MKHSEVEFETPLLIPSFSSKGFSFAKDGVSEVADVFKLSTEFLTESLLISAYDLYYNHLPLNEDLLCTEVLMLDSGGYETSEIYDLSTTSKYSYPIKDWDLSKLNDIISKWPSHKPTIIVSYDHGDARHSLKQQITDAECLFAKYPDCASNFLIKPEKDTQRYIQIDSIITNIRSLASFTIIGVTEKELGNSILERMKNIKLIRDALDKISVSSPIHIFGSLDPITSILYFLAGAEIFDGLTWLKYSYYNNAAIYNSNFGVLNSELGINVKDSKVKSLAITKNIYYLEKMKYAMKDYIMHKDFNVFDEIGGTGFGEIIERSFKKFTSNS